MAGTQTTDALGFSQRLGRHAGSTTNSLRLTNNSFIVALNWVSGSVMWRNCPLKLSLEIGLTAQSLYLCGHRNRAWLPGSRTSCLRRSLSVSQLWNSRYPAAAVAEAYATALKIVLIGETSETSRCWQLIVKSITSGALCAQSVAMICYGIKTRLQRWIIECVALVGED